jgi:hypothetical protein
MSSDEPATLAEAIRSVARYDAEGGTAELAAAVAILRANAAQLHRQFAELFVMVVRLAERNHHLRELDALGLLSDLSRSLNSDLLRAAAFAHWKLGDHEQAGRLQAASLAHATADAGASGASLESRVSSVIERYRTLGTTTARDLASESFEQISVESDEFRTLTVDFVLALDIWSDTATGPIDTIVRKLSTAPEDQDLCRLAAFICWRRKNEVGSSEWQHRSLRAPRLGWTLDQVHYLASRANAGRGRR